MTQIGMICVLPERDDRLDAGRFPPWASTTHAAPSCADVCMTTTIPLDLRVARALSSCTATN
jgi:hypothetical protein